MRPSLFWSRRLWQSSVPLLSVSRRTSASSGLGHTKNDTVFECYRHTIAKVRFDIVSSDRASAEVAYIEVPRLGAWLVSREFVQLNGLGILLDFALLQPVHVDVNAICIPVNDSNPTWRD